MLNADVKNRINTCRDILVGKLPDPKSQVLQITNALIYKFMDDQDRQAEKLSGKASFFIKDLKPYAWHKLFDSKLTNQERADLYITGIEKLSQAKHLPELFREIFKEAYVPFRAAGTIVMFIDEINKFDYNHSEELGNAYEYLLSIMGSQGDAGQFRTPRHIIEFLVDVVDPQKGETIYDPAAGTAGFLIAAYKHILESNDNKLSASERKKLAENIEGVDISPDMAKMARVNLYLHGFTTPVINEGDTLSDEELWGKKYNVILANPPFMSPKGGIVPHNKFSIKAKRSEVLFVDYIAEHLKLKGRAGIIVPEGIIFQSQTVYKDLRKMLVEDSYLQAVISLPAGVFQPYSGVKTSILILDRERAKENSEILFLKIENDGYTVSSQRTERDGSQLPEALAIARAWNQGKKQESPIASWVSKKEIAESGDYNLTGERYRVFENKETEWPIVKVGDICTLMTGGTPRSSNTEYYGGNIKWLVSGDIHQGEIFDCEGRITSLALKESNARLLPVNCVLIALNGQGKTRGTVAILRTEAACNQSLVAINPDRSKLLPEFLYFLLRGMYKQIRAINGDNQRGGLNMPLIRKIEIPLPPIEVQREIVAELDRYQKIIDGARQVVQNYKPSFKIESDWERVELNELCNKITDGTHSTPKYTNEGVPFLRVTDLTKTNDSKKFISEEEHKELIKRCKPEKDDVLYSKNGTIGVAKLVDWDWEFSIFVSLALLKPKKELILPKYLELFMNSDMALLQATARQKSGTVTNLHLIDIKTISVPLPPLQLQQSIIDKQKNEQDLISSNEELIRLYEQKIQDKIAEVWGE